MAYLIDRDVPFSRVSSSLVFLAQGSKEGCFSGTGCQNMSKGDILLDRFAFWSNLYILEHTFHRFGAGCHFEGKNSGAG